MVFIDDIFIFSNSVEEHAAHCQAIVRTLNQANLKLNIKKSKFGCQSMLVLGHRISVGGQISADPTKVWKLQGTLRPHSKKQLQSFMGFVNFLIRYVPFAHRFTGPLHTLQNLIKVQDKDWTPAHQKAFEALQTILSRSVILQKPLPNVQFQVATDASLYGVGAVLFQEEVVDGKLTKRYIDMASMALAKHQRNYSASKRELLAIVFAVRRFHPYLFAQKFHVLTDHRALTYMFSDNPSYMIQDWMGVLLEYSFTVSFLPGVENIVPDYLSRLYEPDDKVTVRIRRANLVVDELLKLPEKELQHFISERFDKVSPPADRRAELLKQVHESTGHFGAENLFKQLFSVGGFWWPGMKADCTAHSASCIPCLRWNVGKSGFQPLRPRNVSEIFECWAIDLAEIPTSDQGYNFALIMVDMASGFTILAPLKDKGMLTIARELFKAFGVFGFPRQIQSDKGDEFINDIIKSVRKVALIEARVTVPWNPRANGMAESRVKSFKSVLYKVLGGKFAAWESYIPMITLAINGKHLDRTGTTPYTLVFSRSSPIMSCVDPSRGVPAPMSIKDIMERSERIRQIIHPELFTRAQYKQLQVASRFDSARHAPPRAFKAGAAVMVKRPPLAPKTEPRYSDPLTIFEMTDNGNARLANLDGSSYGAPVTIDRLKLVSANFWRELADMYEVEAILTHRLSKDKKETEYFVKWKGYEDKHNSWVPEHDMFASATVKAYWKVLREKYSKDAVEARHRFPNRRLTQYEKVAQRFIRPPIKGAYARPARADDDEEDQSDDDRLAATVIAPRQQRAANAGSSSSSSDSDSAVAASPVRKPAGRKPRGKQRQQEVHSESSSSDSSHNNENDSSSSSDSPVAHDLTIGRLAPPPRKRKPSSLAMTAPPLHNRSTRYNKRQRAPVVRFAPGVP